MWCSWKFHSCSASTTVHAGDMEMFSVAYVSGHCQTVASRCQLWCMQDMLYIWSAATNQCLHIFKEYSDKEQSLTYSFEKLIEAVGAAVTLMESMMTEVGHLNSVEQHITAVIKNSNDFECIWYTGCSLHHLDGIVRDLMRIYIPWWYWWRNRFMSEAARQRATKVKINILAHQ
jgi:hypothetical protein